MFWASCPPPPLPPPSLAASCTDQLNQHEAGHEPGPGGHSTAEGRWSWDSTGAEGDLPKWDQDGGHRRLWRREAHVQKAVPLLLACGKGRREDTDSEYKIIVADAAAAGDGDTSLPVMQLEGRGVL